MEPLVVDMLTKDETHKIVEAALRTRQPLTEEEILKILDEMESLRMGAALVEGVIDGRLGVGLNEEGEVVSPPAPRREPVPRSEHKRYTDSRDWKLQHAYRVDLAGGRCERCGSNRRLQAHHLNSDRVGQELLEEVEVLCRACHMLEHGLREERSE